MGDPSARVFEVFLIVSQSVLKKFDFWGSRADLHAAVSFSERRLSLLRVEVYEALATATGEIRVWLRL